MRALIIAISLLTMSLFRAGVVHAEDAQADASSEAQLKEELFDWITDSPNAHPYDLIGSWQHKKLLKHRFNCLVGDANGNADHGWSLYDDIMASSTFPYEGLRLIDDRFWVSGSCRQHDCPQKLMMIADQQTRNIHFSILHYSS